MPWYDPTSWFDSDSEAQAKKDGDILFDSNPQPGDPAYDTRYKVSNEGTPYERRTDVLQESKDPLYSYKQGGSDARDYMYGRTPNGANDAVNKAWGTGDGAMQVGQMAINAGVGAGNEGGDLLGQRTGDAQYFQGRQAPYTAGQLAGLESTEGPSAAQAQLQQGTNQALGSQIALARSGRGFGGNAASAGLAQTNMAGIQANQVNAAAGLRAQENAAWRGRQAANLGAAGQQILANQGQNDAATMNSLGLGQQAYFQGQGLQQQGYGTALQGVGQNINAQNTAAGIRGQELGAGANFEDNQLRAWAAQNGYDLGQQQRSDQQNAAALNTAGTIGSTLIMASDVRAKTRIAPADGAGEDFARGFGGGLGFDGTLYREQTRGGGPNNPQRPVIDTTGEEAPPMTAMQAQYMGPKPSGNGGGESGAPAQPGVLDHANTRPMVKPVDTDALDAAAVRNSPASFYDYKDPGALGASPGRKYGPMAQDLLKTPAGASAVVKQPDGSLGVDTGRLALVQHGAISEQQKRIDALSAQLDAITNGQQQQGFDYGGYAR